MGFCDEQLQRVRPIWDRMLSHRFLIDTRDGTISDEVFATWMRQDYLFVEAAIPFISILIAKAPQEHVEQLTQTIAAFYTELETTPTSSSCWPALTGNRMPAPTPCSTPQRRRTTIPGRW
jgi:thiaminase